MTDNPLVSMSIIERLASRAGMYPVQYEQMVMESWAIDNSYECPECGWRVPNGETCSCKASDRS